MRSIRWRAAVSVLSLGLLASCGGGDGGSVEPAPAPPSGLCATGVAFGTVTRAQARVGNNAAAAVLGCSGRRGTPERLAKLSQQARMNAFMMRP